MVLFVPEGRLIFAQTAFDVEENIRYLKDMESSLKAQAKNMAVLEEQLMIEEEANIQLNQRLNELQSEYSVFLADIIRDKKVELDKFNKAKLNLTGKLKKFAPVYKSVKTKPISSGNKEEAVNLGLQKLKDTFIKEKQILDAKVFSLELELESKNRELEQVLIEKTKNEGELKARISVLEKERNLLGKAAQDNSDKWASFETVLKEKEDLERQLKLLKESFKEQLGNLYYYVGLAYTQAKIYPDAVEAYVTSLEYKPDNPEAHCNLGLLYAYQGNEPQKALYHLSQALELNPHIENHQTIKALVDSAKEEKGGQD
jgi:tetratricopeptide (TPR) repeat protein